MANTRRHSRTTTSNQNNGLLYSTTEGRQRFPDILQTSYGDKAVIGFGRYGRALGAVVPVEAVRVLAGFSSSVDEDVRRRIERTAKSLLRKLPNEAALCGLGAEFEEEPQLVEMAEIDSRRSKVKKVSRNVKRKRAL